MQITILLFGMHRERLAKATRGRLELALPDGMTLRDLLAKLEIQGGVLATVNGQQEKDLDRPLADGDEVSLVPPVGGGARSATDSTRDPSKEASNAI